MKTKKIVSAFFLLFLGVFLANGEGQEKLQKIEAGEKGTKSLIRKELLLKKKIKLEPPQRNIFSVHKTDRQEKREDISRPQQNPSGNPAFSREAPSPGQLQIRYVGYVISGEKVIALIIFRGNTLAVEKGEMISEGVKVGEITSAAIEIVSSNSEKRKFPLEGEKE
ncbi:MAG: hypothetical protein ISS41_03605 [Candidatus Aminicenantes bacterium]|nr:hypothetical protein [Candidatus Aminicenantes bacterium]MBL7082703.1 hypothetical protein [Candidatus Aminicenantes bacterium]